MPKHFFEFYAMYKMLEKLHDTDGEFDINSIENPILREQFRQVIAEKDETDSREKEIGFHYRS